MKAVSKKLLSLLLVAILLVSALPMSALAAETHTLTLNAVGTGELADGTIIKVHGSVSGGSSVTRVVTKDEAVGDLPNAITTGFTFVGWFFEDGTELRDNDKWTLDGDATVYAHYVQKTNTVTIKAIINDDVANAKVLIPATKVSAGTQLLSYLEGVKGTVSSILASDYPGYSWYKGYWYDYSGTIPLNTQDQDVTEHQIVCVKLYSNEYTLSFNANGGSVNPTSKKVKFGQVVGTLPTPTRSGYLFRGWYDENGVLYNSKTVYNILGNTILYADWAKQETVVLEIYLNGNTATPDRCPVLTGYAAGDTITQQDVEKIVKQYYSAKTGTSLSLQGLYDVNTWQNYLKNKNEAGAPSIEVKEGTTYVYVMVNNAKQGATPTTPTTGNPGNPQNPTTGRPADPSNPKTGDNSMIYGSMTVMLMAATALVVMEQLRKRKMI